MTSESMSFRCARCDKPVDPYGTGVIVQLSFTEEHRVWCDVDCFRSSKA